MSLVESVGRALTLQLFAGSAACARVMSLMLFNMTLKLDAAAPVGGLSISHFSLVVHFCSVWSFHSGGVAVAPFEIGSVKSFQRTQYVFHSLSGRWVNILCSYKKQVSLACSAA